MHGRPLAYLDSASSSQKPRQVLDAMRECALLGLGVLKVARRPCSPDRDSAVSRHSLLPEREGLCPRLGEVGDAHARLDEGLESPDHDAGAKLGEHSLHET
jgi:hypothetical protein